MLKRSKLFILLSALTKDEWKSLGLFLRSPYFNTNKQVIALYDFLTKYYPEFDVDKVNGEKVFASVFNGKPFKEGTLRNLYSDAITLIEQFFIQEDRVHSNSAHTTTSLLQFICKRDKLNDLMLGYYKNAIRTLDEIQRKDENTALNYSLQYQAIRRYHLGNNELENFAQKQLDDR